MGIQTLQGQQDQILLHLSQQGPPDQNLPDLNQPDLIQTLQGQQDQSLAHLSQPGLIQTLQGQQDQRLPHLSQQDQMQILQGQQDLSLPSPSQQGQKCSGLVSVQWMILIVYLMTKRISLEKTLKNSAWSTALQRTTALLGSSSGRSASVGTWNLHTLLL